MYRVIVTGTRQSSPEIRTVVWQTLDSLTFFAREREPILIVHGQCPAGGVDKDAEDWAINRGHQAERHPADFAGKGPSAGPQRNAEMVEAGADRCVGFPGPGSRGTWDCLRKAVDAGIPTHVYPVGLRSRQQERRSA